MPEPVGGVPLGLEPEPEPLPMFGQFLVEPLPVLELEPEPDELEPEPVPEPVLLDPLDPVLEVLELDDGVVVEELVLAPEAEPEPVVPVVDEVEVVAASATSAPPASSPVVSAPMANTLRSRSFMIVALSFVCCADPFGPACIRCALDLWLGATRPQRNGRVSRRLGDDSQPMHGVTADVAGGLSSRQAGAQDTAASGCFGCGPRAGQRLSARQQ